MLKRWCIPSKAMISAGHHMKMRKNSDALGITAENVKLDFSKVQEFKDSVVNKLNWWC